MSSIQYQIRQHTPEIDESAFKSKIAIDRSPICPLSNLDVGFNLQMRYSSVNHSPLSIKPFIRAMKARSEAALADMPLVITQLAESGPDSDFTMSIEALSAIVTAVCFNTPLALVFYNIDNHYYFDEPLHHESHPWSHLFTQNDLPIDGTSAENITLLSVIANNAFDQSRTPQWFSNLKGDVVFSERSQQRWFRDTEKFLPNISEDFTRSFAFGLPDLSLHIGSNSVLCETESDEPSLLRYCKQDPTEIQNCKWILEAILSSCKNILLTSSECMKLTRFEKITVADNNPKLFSALFDLLYFIKANSKDFGCFMLHKRGNSDFITLRKVKNEELEEAKLTDSYRMRVSLLEMVIGFRQTLSTNNKIVENGRKLLFRAIEYTSPINASLCFERIGDSLILPVLLEDRYKSLIVANQPAVEQVEPEFFSDALNCYSQALLCTENLPLELKTSLHHKIATTLFANAVSSKNDKFAAEAIKVEEIDHEFKLKVAIWRCNNAISCESEKAQLLAYLAIGIAESDKEKEEPKRLLAIAINAEAQSNVTAHRYTRASERFNAAQKIFEELNDLENMATTEANLAHIERCLADSLSREHQGKFTQEEERRLMSAAKYYLIAIDRIKDKKQIHDELCLNLASLYRSILTRYTQCPPINRMKVPQIEEEAHRCIKEAANLLNGLSDNKSTEIQRQIAALNTWNAKFIAEFEMKHSCVNDEAKKTKLAATAKSLFGKARQYFIADNYPADFVSITLSLSALRLACGQPLDAMRVAMECLRALRPTSIAIRQQSFQQQNSQQSVQVQNSQQRSVLGQMLPSVLETLRNILKDMLFDKVKRKQPCEFEKGLYRSALEAKEEGVINLMLDLKKALKI